MVAGATASGHTRCGIVVIPTYTIAKSQETSRQPDLLRVMLRVPRAGPHYVQQIYVRAPPIPYTKSPTEPDPTAKIRAARLPVQRRVAIVS